MASRYVDESGFTWLQKVKRMFHICPLDGGKLFDYYGHQKSLKCNRGKHTFRYLP